MGDCGCKKNKVAEPVVTVHMTNVSKNRQTTDNVLMEALRFTPYQTETIVNTVIDDGKALIYEGPVSKATSIVERLSKHGIYCEVKSKRLLR